MSKVYISPLLNSMFKRSDVMTKDEAETLVSNLSVIGDDTVKISLSQGITTKTKKFNYMILSKKDKNYDEVVSLVNDILNENGWKSLKSHSYDQGTWRVWFCRK